MVDFRFLGRGLGALAVGCASLAGCTGPADDGEKEETYDWTELPDGSFFTNYELESSRQVAERCWPEKSDFYCVAASHYGSEGMKSREVSNHFRNYLPGEPVSHGAYEAERAKKPETRSVHKDRVMGRPTTESGYLCQQMPQVGYVEVVKDTLGKGLYRNNDISIDDEGNVTTSWTKEDLKRKIRQYAGGSPGYFDCFDILLRTSGSLSNLGSESITRERVDYELPYGWRAEG